MRFEQFIFFVGLTLAQLRCKRRRKKGERANTFTLKVDILDFICPISNELMVDPVTAKCGNIFERDQITEWIIKGNTTSPITRMQISVEGLIENRFMKSQIERFVNSKDCSDEMKKKFQEKKKELNMVKSKKLYKEGEILEAANLGHPGAMGEMAYNFREGEGGVEVNYDKAFDFATKAAKENDEWGIFQLGCCYSFGVGVVKNWVEALEWFKRCDDEYYNIANHCSGNIYYNGKYGVDQNYEKAAECYRMAADLGHDYAQFYLAEMYFKGEGVAQSFVEAHKWFKMAADQDHSFALFKLGKMLINDNNFAEGIVLILKSSEQGNKAAGKFINKLTA